MPIKSSGQIGLTDISAEFGGPTVPTALSNYYSGGTLVPAGTVGFPGGVSTVIPSSGRINLSNFYGSSKQIVQQFYLPGLGLFDLTIPAGRWFVYSQAVGAGGGGGGGDAGIFGTNGGNGGSFRAKFTINAAQTGKLVLVTGTGGGVGGGQGGGLLGGKPGRGLSYMNTSNLFDVDVSSNPAFYSTMCDNRPGVWNSELTASSVWSPIFDQQNMDSRIPIAVFFPTAGNYTFRGAGDDQFNLYIDTPTRLVGNFTGFSTIKSVTGFVTQGWHTLYFSASNSGGGQRGIGLIIIPEGDPPSTGRLVFSTRGLVGGGLASGNYYFLNGGEGGSSGRFGSSGSAGGGGAGTALLWYPSNNPLVDNNYSILGIAPGGGGGAGTGRFINPGAQGGIYNSNWWNRGATTDIFNIIQTQSGPSTWWFGRNSGNRVPYQTGGELRGQGAYNSDTFFPPSIQNGWTRETSSWDGGAGGGGGAPWGPPGGYAEKSDSIWSVGSDKTTTFWSPPNESSGAGGNQGWIFLNPSFVNSYETSQTNTYYPGYGLGGIGGYGQGSFGQSGAISVRVSNVDDGIYPGT